MCKVSLQVISTCSTDAVDTLLNLGADIVIDYKQNDADTKIISEGPLVNLHQILKCTILILKSITCFVFEQV